MDAVLLLLLLRAIMRCPWALLPPLGLQSMAGTESQVAPRASTLCVVVGRGKWIVGAVGSCAARGVMQKKHMQESCRSHAEVHPATSCQATLEFVHAVDRGLKLFNTLRLWPPCLEAYGEEPVHFAGAEKRRLSVVLTSYCR